MVAIWAEILHFTKTIRNLVKIAIHGILLLLDM